MHRLKVHALERVERVASFQEPSWNRIIVVSNRLPFKVVCDAENKPTIRPSSGGLVTAMSPLLRRGIAGKWIGWPGDAEEEALEDVLRSGSVGQFDVGIVTLTKTEVEKYYVGYANEVLAPALAGETGKIDLQKATTCWPAYRAVQAKFADKVCEDLRPKDIVWVHDYHLAGVAKELRLRNVQHLTGFFLHMPFPAKEELRAVPQHRLLLRDLLAYDIVGFQTSRFMTNFIGAVREYQPDARVIVGSDGLITVIYGGHATRLGSFPVSIDTHEFERQLYHPKTQQNVRRLRAMVRQNGSPQVIFNAGRQDYSKGFLEELHAFDLLLKTHPELIGRVVLYQLIIPSRGAVSEHRKYKEEVVALAKKINRRYGTVVRQTHAHMSRTRYLAYLNVADIQSVPTKSDGMNLIAKESAVVGNPTTVLILGRNAGAAEELGEHALLIDPDSIGEFADTLFRALTMSEVERRRRKNALKSIVTANDVFCWWSCAQEPLFQRVWDEKRCG
jgi:trehalose 6-phosphate synthase/phosphatase